MQLKPVDTIKIFCGADRRQSFKAGEVIFKEGETGAVMYGIIDGEVEMRRHDKAIEVLRSGDVFGQGALVHEDGLRESTAIAKTDCQLASLDREHFLFAVQQTPMFALEVMKSYSDRFRQLKAHFY